MPATVSGPTAIFRLSSGQDLTLTVSLQQSSGSPLTADIAFRFLQRLSLATAERLERLLLARAEAEPGEPRSSAAARGLGGRRDGPEDLGPARRAATCRTWPVQGLDGAGPRRLGPRQPRPRVPGRSRRHASLSEE